MSRTTPHLTDLSKYIEMRDGRPYVRGRQLPVIFVAKTAEDNQLSVEELAYEYTLSSEQVLAALLYYREHKSELDVQDDIDSQESQELNRRFGGQPGQRRG